MNRLVCIIALSFTSSYVNAQIDIAHLDTSQWMVDTTAYIALVFPKFQFNSDTTIVFVDASKQASDRLLTLHHKKGAPFVVGDYTSTHGVESVYLYLNVPSGNISRSKFLSLVDTVFQDEYGAYHCVSVNSISFRNTAVRNELVESLNLPKLLFEREWIILSRQLQGENVPYRCLSRFELIEEYEPPYHLSYRLIDIEISE